MQSRLSIIKKSVAISAVVVLFIFSCGGSFNPLSWKSQAERRVSPQVLIQPEKMASFHADIESYAEGDLYKAFEFIESEILYTSDFFNHASLDHLATAEEVLSSGQDDCDGQAVLLCSVLRYEGLNAFTVIGPSHAWVEVETDETLLINYKGGKGFVRFNESSVEWQVTPLILLVLEEFLLLVVIFSVLLFAYEKGLFTLIQEVFGYFRYVFLFLLGYVLIGALVLWTQSTLWVFGLLIVVISILLIMKVVAALRKRY